MLQAQLLLLRYQQGRAVVDEGVGVHHRHLHQLRLCPVALLLLRTAGGVRVQTPNTFKL
jgi:hypothetical protein